MFSSSDTKRKREGFAGARSLREPVFVVVASLVLIGVFTYAPLLIPWAAPYSGVLVAAAFIYLPAMVVWRAGEELHGIGVRLRGFGPAVPSVAVVSAIVFTLFSAGFFAYHRVLNDQKACFRAERLAAWPARFTPGGPASSGGQLELWSVGHDDLLLRNDQARSVGVQVRREPKDFGLLLRSARGQGRAVEEAGRMTLGPQESLLLRFPEGPGELELWGEAEIRAGGGGATEDSPLTVQKNLWWILNMIWVHLLLVAVPEEIFYRGYLQTRLTGLFRRRWMVLGADMGPAVIVTSAVFAAGHLIAVPSPGRLAVFFPSLFFGWVRNRSGSVVPAAVLHCASNVLLAVCTRFLC